MFSINGGCTIASISDRERKRAKIHLRASGALSHDEGIEEAVEEVAFDDVERKAQHRPDRLKKPRNGSVGTDR